MAEPIKIKITDETGTQTVDVNNGVSGEASSTLKTEKSESNRKRAELAAAGTVVAMRAVSYATSNIGKYTGSRRNQAVVNNARTVVAYGTTFAANIWLGIATVATDATSSFIDYMYERDIDRHRSQQMLARIGDKGGYRR